MSLGFVSIKGVSITFSVNIFEYLNRICVDTCENENYLVIRTQQTEQISQENDAEMTLAMRIVEVRSIYTGIFHLITEQYVYQ